MKDHVLLTGATGFLGNALLRRLSSQYEVVAQVRKLPVERLVGDTLDRYGYR